MSFSLIYNLTDVKSASNNPTAIDTTATVVLETMYGYDLPATVTVTGADGSWDRTTGTLSLSNPTSDVTITAAGAQIHYINVANLKKFWNEMQTKLKLGTAYGDKAVAYGESSVAGVSGQNYYATAYGYSSHATGNYSTAIGYNAYATNSCSTAIGYNATAKADYASSLGYMARAEGQYSIAIGCGAITKIDNTASFYGHFSAARAPTIIVRDTEKIFFANEDASTTTNNYTSLSDFAGGKTLKQYLDAKQATLVSGTNIKTINGYSVLGSGNLNVSKRVALYSGSCGYSVTLNTNYNVHDDFDILIVFCQYNSADSQQSHTVIDTAWCDNMNNSYNFNIHENVVKLQYNPQTHVLWNDNNNCMIYKVLGIKFYNN